VIPLQFPEIRPRRGDILETAEALDRLSMALGRGRPIRVASRVARADALRRLDHRNPSPLPHQNTYSPILLDFLGLSNGKLTGC